MRIAAQLYTVRERILTVAGLTEVLGRLREIGYEAVEVAGLEAAVAQHVGEELTAAGLLACAAHETLESLTGDLPALASQCRRWGCEYLVVPSLPAEYHSAAGFQQFAREAREIAVQLRQYGLRLAYHNHSFELEKWGGRTGLEILFDSTAPMAFGAELDTYWLQHGGASPAAWIHRLTGRVPLVHLKDMTVSNGEPVQTEIGQGNLDWPAILSACRAAGTDWMIVEQDHCERDPLDSLAVSFENLTELLANSRLATPGG